MEDQVLMDRMKMLGQKVWFILTDISRLLSREGSTVNTCEYLFLKFLSALPSNKLEITGVLVNIYTRFTYILLLPCNSLYKRVEHSENTLTIFIAPPTSCPRNSNPCWMLCVILSDWLTGRVCVKGSHSWSSQLQIFSYGYRLSFTFVL